MTFSIILPIRNGGELAKQCINSILGQSYPTFNLIILDNHSSDDTPSWILSLRDPRIIFLPSESDLTIEKNWSRIKGLSHRNEFITLIGHDDILNVNYLDAMIDLIQLHPHATLYQSHFSYIDSSGKFIRNCIPMEGKQTASLFLQSQMTNSIDSTGTGYMMRAVDYDKVGGMPTDYPNLIYADYALWVKLTELGYKATSKENSFAYRIHDSVSKLTNGEQYFLAFEKYIYFLNEQAKNNEEIRTVIEKYGRDFLLFKCQVMAHRILKTAIENRNLNVRLIIEKFKSFAVLLNIKQPFHPRLKLKILLAEMFDFNNLSRAFFYFLKNFN